ncbi:MAG: SDR family oxidoreductase [Chitinophagaceae bacterium]|nr:SDR family oxidoreductase [Oligoflexus sp.]
MKVSGKTIWITGASSGIGEALAYALARAGARLILSSRNEAELSRVKNACASPTLHAVEPIDLSQLNGLETKAQGVWDLYGPVDILINNAGVSQRYLALDSSLELDRKIMDVNFYGTVALTRPILKNMAARKSGQIVVIASVLGLYGMQTRTTYAASKHALRGYFQSLRNELFGTALTITLIYPGYVTTKVSENALTADGKTHGKTDVGHAKGISPKSCAESILKAIEKNKAEVVIAGPKEALGVYVARWFPALFRAVSARINV